MVPDSSERIRSQSGTILVVEDDASMRRLTQVQLDRLGYKTKLAEHVAGALEILRRETVDLVICDLHLPAVSGLELLKTVRADHPETKFVIVTGYGSVHTAIEAMKSGAYDYLTKPLHPVELRTLVARAFEQQRPLTDGQDQRSRTTEKYGFKSLIGESTTLADVIDTATRAARTDASVLITGETGTGKELLAKAIHFNSSRHERPFVIVNCGSIPKDLVESELFGHVKGAFTGALMHKQGRAEMASGGTLFLDEIGEMPLDIQVRMLRLVQEGEIQKVGSASTTHVDVRIIAATHRNLEEQVQSGAFREDLYYRLAVVPIELPPLRKRLEDIPELVQYFFRQSKDRHHRENLELSPSVISCFTRYDWPGNVRQLANCILRIVVLAPGPEITVNDLPDFLQKAAPPNASAAAASPSPFSSAAGTLDAIERHAILDALEKCNWNQTRAASYLGVTRKILRGRVEKYGIRRAE